MGERMTNYSLAHAAHAPAGPPTALAAGSMFGPWLWPADGPGWQVLLAAAASLVAGLQLLWLYRARSARRRKTALDAYAAEEIARQRRWKATPEPRPHWR